MIYTKVIWFPTWRCQLMALPAFDARRPCPYCASAVEPGYALYLGERTHPLNTPAPPLADLVAFFRRHAQLMNWLVDICGGGEPMLQAQQVSDVLLTATEITAAVTSNTLYTPGIDLLFETGAIDRVCLWTCSYHPGAHRDEEFVHNYRRIRDRLGRPDLPVTVVAAPEMMADLPRHVAFLQDLGAHYQFHLDSFRNPDYATLRARIQEVAPHRGVYAGEPRFNQLCQVYRHSCCVVPSGLVYPCVMRGTVNDTPIGHVSEGLDLHSLPEDHFERCPRQCSMPCDFPKHMPEPPA